MITFRPSIVLVAPLLLAVAVSVVLFLVSPGFSILVVLTTVAMIPGAGGTYFAFRAMMRWQITLHPERSRAWLIASGIVVAELAWLMAWLSIPLVFALFSRPSFDDPTTSAVEVVTKFAVTVVSIAFPPLVIFLVATPFTVPFAIRRTEVRPTRGTVTNERS